jgi:hypothetical protein
LIYQKRVHHTTDFDQPLPFPAIPRESRNFPGRHRAYLPQTDFGNHPFKSCPGYHSCRRPAEIIIHNVDIPPAQLPEPFLHGVL